MEQTEHEKRFIVASIMAHQLGVRYDVSDEEMNAMCARAFEIMFAAEHDNVDAGKVMLAATGRLSALVTAICAGRRDKPTH